MQDRPAPQAAPGEPSPGLPPLPPRGPRPGSAGCLRILSIGCGGFFAVALTALGIILLNFRAFVIKLEKDYVLGVVERTGLRDSEKEVGQVLDTYEAEAKKEKLGVAQWRAALEAFSRSPAALALGLLDARAKLDPLAGHDAAATEKAKQVLERLAAAIAEGRISSQDLRLLVERARPKSGPEPEPPGKPADARELSEIDHRELARFIPEAEKLLEERGASEPPAKIDLPALLRRDLAASLEEGRGKGG